MSKRSKENIGMSVSTPLNIKDAEAYWLASEIARHTGKSLARVVVDALRAEHARTVPVEWDLLEEVLAKVHAMPDQDPRPSSEIFAELYSSERGFA